jgi:hypothetical protein
MTAMTLTTTRQPRTAPVRLTRRGRAVLLLVLLAVALVAFSLGRFSSPSDAARPGSAPAADGAVVADAAVVVVQPGESLWEIARRVAPDADPRRVVAQLKAVNDLDGAVRAGQRLTLPAGLAG